MSRFILSSLGFGLVSLIVACNGSEECADCPTNEAVGHDNDTADDTDDPCADCPDDSGDTDDTGNPDATATFIGPAVSFTDGDGVITTESCTTHLEASGAPSYVVATDEEKLVEPATYTAKFGDLSMASDASDDLPLHTLANGWLAISPAVEVPVVEGDPVKPAAPTVNVFIEGDWTCEDDSGFVEDGQVTYEQGYLLYLPSVGQNIEVNGMNLFYDDGDVSKEGAFITNTWLYIESTGGMAGDYTADCWLGDESDDPR